MKPAAKKIVRFFLSPRLTVTLFVAFLLLFGLGLVFPQKTMMPPEDYAAFGRRFPALASVGEAVGLTDLYRSRAMTVLFWAFSSQIVLFLLGRSPRILSEVFGRAPLPHGSMRAPAAVDAGTSDPERVAAVLEGLGYAVHRAADGSIRASRNASSRLGTLLFHGSFLLLMAGGWVSVSDRFHGDVPLAEGQPFGGQPAEYLRTLPIDLPPDRFPPVSFMLERIAPVLSPVTGAPVDLECEVRFPNDLGGGIGGIAVNEPLYQGGASIQVKMFGAAPAFSVRNRASGAEVDAVCTNLMIWSPGSPQDTFRLLRPPALVSVRLFPDHVQGPDGVPSSRSQEMRNPVLEVSVRPDDPALPGALGLLRPGGALPFGPYELRLEGIRRWGMFHISREPGGGLLVIGFLLMISGAAFRLLRPRRWITATRAAAGDGGGLRIGGRSEWFHESFADEIEGFLEKVRETSSPGAPEPAPGTGENPAPGAEEGS